MDRERLISLREAAAQSGLSDAQLRLLARKGRLVAVKLGRDWFTTPEAVAAYLADSHLRSHDPRKYQRD